MKGIFGKYLDINLSRQEIKTYEIPQEWYTKYLGGRGIGIHILLKELKGYEDPLGEENILVFATGPLQGTKFPGAGRHAILSKSPRTGSLSDSYAGGFFGHELGSSGYDGIFIRGKASRPCYISLIDGKAEIHDASQLWGKDVGQTDEILNRQYTGARIACIGQAGENLVKFSSIINEMNRAAGRAGFGAVMGSKRLKAIVVKGSVNKPVFNDTMLKEVRKRLAAELMANPNIREFGEYGTTGTVDFLNEEGILPTKNFMEGTFLGSSKIDGASDFYRAILVGRDTCAGCPIRCKRIVKCTYKEKYIEEKYGGPEYETLAAFGSNCLNDNLKVISLANQMCNMFGLDTISTGSVIASSMEASEKGLIKEQIKWGDPDVIIDLIEKITFREGIGDLLAEGTECFSKEINADFTMHIKGQEIPFHDPRGKKSVAISYATSPRGAQHMDSAHEDINDGSWNKITAELGLYGEIDRLSWENKAEFCKATTDLASFSNSAITCAFIGYDAAFACGYNPYPLIREAVYATTGLGIGVREMLEIGERNFNMLKIAAAGHGYSKWDDDLPQRLKQVLSDGKSANECIDDEILKKSINRYYELRGFDDLGPTDETLSYLKMDEFIGFIKRKGKTHFPE